MAILRSSPCSRQAASDTHAFAVVLVAFLVPGVVPLVPVRQQDRPEYRASTARYLAAMLVSIVVIAISAVLPTDGGSSCGPRSQLGGSPDARFGWVSQRGSVTGIVPTDAMVERFDLLIIIVLARS